MQQEDAQLWMIALKSRYKLSAKKLSAPDSADQRQDKPNSGILFSVINWDVRGYLSLGEFYEWITGERREPYARDVSEKLDAIR